MPLLRALLYLRLTSLRNLLGVRLRRLKQPKYLAGAVAGGAYFWFFFFRRAVRGGAGGLVPALGVAFGDGRGELIGAGALSLFLLLSWILPGDHPGLAFSEAEVAFLFPGPLTRRQLIHYKLLDGLFLSLFGALFFTLLSGGLRHGALGAVRSLACWWSLNANLSLHQTAAALTISRLTRLGLNATRRRLVLGGAAALTLGALLVLAIRSDPATLVWLLWPARLAIAPFLATTTGGLLLALLPAAGLVALQYFWIHRMESPFEDASIVRAQKTGEMVARMRSGRMARIGGGPRKGRPAPFRLGDRLPPELALLWKNLMVAPAYFNRKVFVGAALGILGGLTWLKRQPDYAGPQVATAAGVIALGLLAYALVVGPQLARNDLRGDLLNIDMLKVYPLPGWRIVLGGLLAPTLLLTALSWLLLLAAATGIVATDRVAGWLTPQFRLAVTAAAATVLPALWAVQLLVPNAATLLFPAWAQNPRHAAAGGIDALGQRLIFFAGQIVCLLVALLPALILGGGTIFLTFWLIGVPAAILLAVLPVLVVFALELWLGVRWLGPKFERLDLSAELRP